MVLGPSGAGIGAFAVQVASTHRHRGQRVLEAGCGTGRDLPIWLIYRPGILIGVDFFNYGRAWEALTQKYCGYPLHFMQGDLGDLKDIEDGPIDIVGSDAVFEHLRNLPTVL